MTNVKTARILKESVLFGSIFVVCRIVDFENYLFNSVLGRKIKSVDDFLFQFICNIVCKYNRLAVLDFSSSAGIEVVFLIVGDGF